MERFDDARTIAQKFKVPRKRRSLAGTISGRCPRIVEALHARQDYGEVCFYWK